MRAPSRPSGERFTILVLVIVGVALLMVGRTDPQVFDDMKTRVMVVMAPILDTVAEPVRKVRDWRQSLSRLSTVYADNERLRSENQELRSKAEQADRLARVIERYQALLNVQVDPRIDYLTARVIGDSGGPFARSIVLNAGREDNLREGQGVVDANGLVGRIVTMGPKASRVLLLTDVTSRIPVQVEPENLRALVAGDGSGAPTLVFLPPGSTVSRGDRVVTSGDGGLIPPGITVGIISDAGGDGTPARIALASGVDALDYVRILRYDLPLDADGTDAPMIPLLPPPPPSADALEGGADAAAATSNTQAEGVATDSDDERTPEPDVAAPAAPVPTDVTNAIDRIDAFPSAPLKSERAVRGPRARR